LHASHDAGVFVGGKRVDGELELSPGDDVEASGCHLVVGIAAPFLQPQRRSFTHAELDERIAEELARAARAWRPTALAMVRARHGEGGRVLEAGLEGLRAGDCVATFAPDEIEMLLPDTTRERAERVVQRTLDEAGVGGAIVGIAVAPEDADGPALLLRAARLALRAASGSGPPPTARACVFVDQASKALAIELGPCPDAADMGVMERFSCKMAIAPTASISIIAGGTSACVEPIPANVYTHKTLSGSFVVKNPYLEKLLISKSKNSDAVWNSILERGGSVGHLDFLTPDEKAVYRTAFEIDQRWLLELAGDRTPFIDQAQSLNLFIPADVEKWDLLMLHYRAWELGIKSLYYLRSMSIQRAGFAGGVEADNTAERPVMRAEVKDYDECLACQ
jgi:hypothetical protein